MSNKIEVIGSLKTKVVVHPVDVLDALVVEALGGYHNWIDVKKDKYFIMHEERKMDIVDREIDEEEYNYIMALITATKYLNLYENC